MIQTRIKLPLFLVLTIVICQLKAQDMLITQKYDTLYGEIIINSLDIDLIDKITFITGGEKETYNALEAPYFTVDGEIYKTFKVSEKYRYLKLEQAGYTSIYRYRPDNSTIFSVMILIKMDGAQLEVPTFGFKKFMSEFTEDCSEVSEDINKGLYKRKDLRKLIADYNTCIDQKTNKIFNRTDSELNKLLMELLAMLDQMTDLAEGEKQEISQILRDIAEKKNKEEDIPSYLKAALESKVSSNQDLYNKAQKLLEY